MIEHKKSQDCNGVRLKKELETEKQKYQGTIPRALKKRISERFKAQESLERIRSLIRFLRIK